MRTALIVTAFVIASTLPWAVGSKISVEASPRAIIAFALGSVAAMAFGLVALLGTFVDPGSLPATDVPLLVGRCADAVGKLFDHPVDHWPSIGAALLLVMIVVRLAYAGVVVMRDARREFRSLALLVDGTAPGSDDVLVVEASFPFALASGVMKRRVVVSREVLASFDPSLRRAVLAHERAHVRGRHSVALLMGRIVTRAFAFVPPIRNAMKLLLLGLEAAADEVAVREVGDPLVVANALLSLAESPGLNSATLGGTGSDLRVRIDRLLRSRGSGPTSRATTAGAMILVAAVLVVMLLALPARAHALTGAARSAVIHDVCHLPHGGS
jgi:hypothetical protein